MPLHNVSVSDWLTQPLHPCARALNIQRTQPLCSALVCCRYFWGGCERSDACFSRYSAKYKGRLHWEPNNLLAPDRRLLFFSYVVVPHYGSPGAYTCTRAHTHAHRLHEANWGCHCCLSSKTWCTICSAAGRQECRRWTTFTLVFSATVFTLFVICTCLERYNSKVYYIILFSSAEKGF